MILNNATLYLINQLTQLNMLRKRFSILIILMMVITPVASAFSHCSGMDMLGDLSESQRMTVTVVVDNATPLNHKDLVEGQNQADMQCHTSNNCAFHVCGGFGMTSSTSSFNAIAASYSYLTSLYSPLYSTALSAEIKPPILTL